jgi:hypothetical protein
MAAELDRAEQKVEDESAALRKELGLRDLVLTQLLFVVGCSPSHSSTFRKPLS